MLSILNKYLSFLGSRKGKVIEGIVWAIIGTIGNAVQFLALYIVLHDLFTDNVTSKTALSAFLIMALSLVIRVVASNFGRKKEVEGSFYMCADKRNEIGDKLKYFPMGYYNNTSIGKIISTITTTLDTIQNVVTRIVGNVIHGAIHAVVIICFMMLFDLRIGLVVLIGIILFMLINTAMQRKAKKVTAARHKAQVELVDAVLEYINGIAVVRSYNLATESNQKLKNTIKECEKQNLALEFVFVPYMFLESICLKLTSVVMILLSLLYTVNGTMNPATCILMIITSMVIFQEIEAAGAMSSLLRLADKAMIDVEDILNVELMDNDSELKTEGNYDISCKNIDFSYDHKKIIDNISVDIRMGETTAIVGPSGGGKTTFCHLLARFWDVDKGAIYLGGKNIKDYSSDALLENFSFVFQDVYLFNDTIANNIKFGKKDATEAEVIAASKKACCHDFIMSFDKGYDTIVGEAGSNLSGGEKQRISIARAIIKDAPIIILDEATANVDPENEDSLQKAITELTIDKTVIMIAHRLKTVRSAKQILVIEEGRLVEQGNHDTLMKLGKIYAKFINMRKQSIGWKLGKRK